MLHVFVLGVRQLLDPSTWPFGILPISMAVFSILFVVLIIRLADLMKTSD